MREIRKLRKAVLATTLSLFMLFSSIPVFACEKSVQNNVEVCEITDAIDIQQAIELLSLTEEEGKEATFYSANIETIESGATQMPTFRMWGYNRGNDRIFNGTKLKTAIVIKGNRYTDVHVRFCSYERVLWTADLIIKDGDYAVDQPNYWQNIMYGGTYFMTYEAVNYGDNGTEVTVVFALV